MTVVAGFGQPHIHFGGGSEADERLALVFAPGFAAAVATQSSVTVSTLTGRRRISFAAAPSFLVLAAPRFLLLDGVLVTRFALPVRRSAIFLGRTALAGNLFRDGFEFRHNFRMGFLVWSRTSPKRK